MTKYFESLLELEEAYLPRCRIEVDIWFEGPEYWDYRLEDVINLEECKTVSLDSLSEKTLKHIKEIVDNWASEVSGEYGQEALDEARFESLRDRELGD